MWSTHLVASLGVKGLKVLQSLDNKDPVDSEEAWTRFFFCPYHIVGNVKFNQSNSSLW